MPPRPAAGQHRAAQPSLGLAGDNDQLSPLAHGPLRPGHTSIHIAGVDEEEHDGGEAQGEIQLYEDEEDDGMHTEEVYDDDGAQGSSALDAATDPSRSGEFDVEKVGCFVGCWRAVLRFPALSTVFPITLFVSLFSAFINVVAAPDAFQFLANPASAQGAFLPSVAGFVIALISTLMLVTLAILATRQLLYQLFQGEIKPLQIVGLYLATILLYGDLYLCCAFLDPTSFVFEQGSGADATTNVVSVFVAFQYFSVSTITCTGYGDIYPRFWFPKVIAVTELALSILYHIGIFSVGLEHFQTVAEEKGKGKATANDDSITAAARRRLKDLRSKYPRLDALRKFFIRYVFGFSLLIQLVFLLVLHIFDANMFNEPDRSADAFLIFIFFIAQCFQFLLILLMTLALVRQINKSYVSPSFLIQSWLATVSLFCGLYVLIYLLIPGFASFHLWNGQQIGAQHAVVDVVGNMFWLSMVTMTTTGYGDVYPVHIAARLAVMVQMVISVCYTVVILGQALASTVGFINAIRIERGADLLRSSHSKSPVPAQGQRSQAQQQQDEDDAEEMSLEGFEGEAPVGSQEYDTQSEVEEEEEEQYSVPPPPVVRAQQQQRKAAPAQQQQSQPQQRQQARAAPAPAPVQRAAAQAPVRSRPAATGAAAAGGAAAAAAAAPSLREQFHDEFPEASDSLAEAGAVVAHAGSQAARAGAAQVRKALPGALAAGQKAVAAGKVAAQAGKAAAANTAARASAALEARAPGLQQEVARDVRSAAAQASTAVRTGAAVAGLAAEVAADRAMQNPEVRQAVNKAKVATAPARQSLAAAAAKAKAAAAQSVQHAREQSKGMFDASSAENSQAEDEYMEGVQQ